MIIQPSPYEDIPNQTWNPMLASVNPVSSAVPKIKLAQPDNTEDWVGWLFGNSEVTGFTLSNIGFQGFFGISEYELGWSSI